jgi:hypothetical protein
MLPEVSLHDQHFLQDSLLALERSRKMQITIFIRIFLVFIVIILIKWHIKTKVTPAKSQSQVYFTRELSLR